jgi:plastocyanin
MAAVIAALLVGGVAACGSDDDSGAGTGDGSTTSEAPAGDGYGDAAGGGEAGTIVAQDFSLTDLTVAAGEEIVLRNDGDATHTATADDGSFDLGEVAGGESSDPATAPAEPGSYPFHCEIHAGMTATLTVEG